MPRGRKKKKRMQGYGRAPSYTRTAALQQNGWVRRGCGVAGRSKARHTGGRREQDDGGGQAREGGRDCHQLGTANGGRQPSFPRRLGLARRGRTPPPNRDRRNEVQLGERGRGRRVGKTRCCSKRSPRTHSVCIATMRVQERYLNTFCATRSAGSRSCNAEFSRSIGRCPPAGLRRPRYANAAQSRARKQRSMTAPPLPPTTHLCTRGGNHHRWPRRVL